MNSIRIKISSLAENALEKILTIVKSKFVKDAFFVQLGTSIDLAFGIITSIYLARFFGPSGYGIYSLIFSIYGMTILLTKFGEEASTVTRLSNSYARGDKDTSSDLLIFLIASKILVASIAFVLGFGILPPLLTLIYDNKSVIDLVRYLFLMPALKIPFSLLTTVLHSFRMMKQRTILGNINTLLIFSSVIILTLLGFGIPGVIFGYVIASLLSSVVAVLFFYNFYNILEQNFHSLKSIILKIPAVNIRKYFKLGFLISLNNKLGDMVKELPILILGSNSSLESISYFRIVLRATKSIRLSVAGFSPNMDVMLPELLAKGDLIKFKKVYFRVSIYSGSITILSTLVLVLLFPYLLKLLYGEKYIGATNLIYYLSIYSAILGFRVGMTSVFKTLNRVDLHIKIKLIVSIITVPIGYILIKELGAIGAALFVNIWYILITALGYYYSTKIINDPSRWGKLIQNYPNANKT